MKNTVYSMQIDSENYFVKELKSNNNVQEVSKNYKLDYNNAQITHYKEIGGTSVIIPIVNNNEKFVVAYYTDKFELNSVKIMELKTEDQKLYISFANTEETYKIVATIENGDLVKREVQGDEVMALKESFLDCLERSFNGLPDWLRWGCYVACGAIWTGAGAAACAGCLAGLGIKC